MVTLVVLTPQVMMKAAVVAVLAVLECLLVQTLLAALAVRGNHSHSCQVRSYMQTCQVLFNQP
jgi:hypothetical protein